MIMEDFEKILIEGRRIARFMNFKNSDGNEIKLDEGAQYKDGIYLFHFGDFKRDWNKIMEVWEKIVSLEDGENLEFTKFEIGRGGIFIDVYLWVDQKWENKHFYHTSLPIEINGVLKYETETFKECFYKTIVEFIEWYDSLKK
jgi:hypothetical protein